MQQISRWFSSRFLAALCVAALAPAAAMADPVITGFNNNRVPLGGLVIIYGSGFGNAQGMNFVQVGGRQVPILAWSPMAISIVVNPLAYDPTPIALDVAYPVQVFLTPIKASNTSNAVNLTITSGPLPVSMVNVPDQPKKSDQPSLTGFLKPTYCAGDTVVIFGKDFGDFQGMSYVSITVPFLDAGGNRFTQEFTLPVVDWTDQTISALLFLPHGAQLGSYTLTVHRSNGKTVSGTFTVVACS